MKYKNRKRGQFTSSTSLWHRQTPNHLKRVNAHAERRELSTSVLDDFCQLAIFRDKNLKVDIHPICPIYTNLSP